MHFNFTKYSVLRLAFWLSMTLVVGVIFSMVTTDMGAMMDPSALQMMVAAYGGTVVVVLLAIMFITYEYLTRYKQVRDIIEETMSTFEALGVGTTHVSDVHFQDIVRMAGTSRKKEIMTVRVTTYGRDAFLMNMSSSNGTSYRLIVSRYKVMMGGCSTTLLPYRQIGLLRKPLVVIRRKANVPEEGMAWFESDSSPTPRA